MGADLLSDIRREIEERLAQLRPAVEEYERLQVAAEEVATGGVDAKRVDGQPKRAGERERALREAILGSLEHGSHTPAELTVVTGEGAIRINRELRRLEAAGFVAKTKREGKLAWSLVS